MYVNEVISYASGWPHLRAGHGEELEELNEVISNLTPELLALRAEADTARLGYRRVVDGRWLQRSGDSLLQESGWMNRRIRSRTRDGLGVSVRRWKNGVGAQFMAYEGLGVSFATWVMVHVPRAYDLGACNLSVLIVPLQEVRHLFDPRPLGAIFSFERCLAQLGDLMPLRHGAPFVILGISHNPSTLQVYHYDVEVNFEEDVSWAREYADAVVEKSIEFPQEYYQAGVSILSYFGEVLKQRHPDVRAKVRIEQDGLMVRMHIESATGDKEIIEKTLEEYGLVVAEELPAEALFDSRLQIIALEQKLELAKMEVRHTHQILALARAGYEERIGDLQEEVRYLRAHIGQHLKQTETVHGLLAQQCESTETLMLAQVAQADRVIQDLLRQAADNRVLFDALTSIEEKLTRGVKPNDEEAVKQALAVIHREKPSMLSQLKLHALNLSYEVSGSYLFKWIEAFAATV